MKPVLQLLTAILLVLQTAGVAIGDDFSTYDYQIQGNTATRRDKRETETIVEAGGYGLQIKASSHIGKRDDQGPDFLLLDIRITNNSHDEITYVRFGSLHGITFCKYSPDHERLFDIFSWKLREPSGVVSEMSESIPPRGALTVTVAISPASNLASIFKSNRIAFYVGNNAKNEERLVVSQKMDWATIFKGINLTAPLRPSSP